MDKKIYTTREVREKVKNYANYLKEAHQVPIQQVFLFGSYAKHKAHAWSDIDVCIVSPFFANQDRLSFLYHRRRDEDIDAMIAPVGFTPEDFRESPSGPLVYEIKKTGKEISLKWWNGMKYFEPEEKQTLEDFENGVYKSVENVHCEKNRYRRYADAALQKDKNNTKST